MPVLVTFLKRGLGARQLPEEVAHGAISANAGFPLVLPDGMPSRPNFVLVPRDAKRLEMLSKEGKPETQVIRKT